MPGFVDVTGWTSEEVRRLGHADDDYDEQPRQRTRQAVPASLKYTVSDVWAAAAAAHRVNDGYVKDETYEWNDQTQTRVLLKRRNRDIMVEFLANPDRILAEDVERGEQVRNFLQKDLTFRGLKGKLNDFDSAVTRCLAVAEFDTVKHRYELAVVACLPNSVLKQQVRQGVDERLKFATGGLFGAVGDKVAAQVEVLQSTYSLQFGIHWITAITDKDQPVSFSSKTPYDPGTVLTIQGKVKAHRNNLTQLNYVKVL